MTEVTQARIVVGVDDSEGSKNALRWAARLATVFGAQLEVVTVWEFVSAYGFGSLGQLSSPHPEIEKLLTATVDEVFGSERPADLRLRVVEGSAASALLSIGKDALMIVVGSRGHGGFAGVLLGSVSARVAEHAKCPVFVVHGDVPESVGKRAR